VEAETYSSVSLQVSEFDKTLEQALLLRESDWVETEDMSSLAVALGQPAAACATERLAANYAQLAPPTAQQVTPHGLLLDRTSGTCYRFA